MKKITKNKLENFFIILELSVGVALIIISSFYFFIGLHNVDLSYNLTRLLGEDIEFYVDRYNSDGDTMSYADGYIMGMEQMNRGYVLGIIGAMFLGLSVGFIEHKMYRRDFR